MSIFKFDNYRRYLRDFLEGQPKRGRGLITKIANHLKLQSSFVSQVLSGQKELSLEQAFSICGYLALSEIESEYFMALVQKERAGTHQLKSYWQKKIQHLKAESADIKNQIAVDKELSNEEKTRFYSSWIYAAVPLFCSVKNGKTIDEIVEWIRVERDLIVDIVRFLINVGMLVDYDNRFKMGHQRVHIEFGSPHLMKHHSNWRIKSLAQAEQIKKEELMFTAPLSVSFQDFNWVREQFTDLIKKISDRVQSSEAETVACINIDLIQVK